MRPVFGLFSLHRMEATGSTESRGALFSTLIWLGAIALALMGCSDQIRYSPSVEVSTHPIQFESEALDAALVDFPGQDLPGSDSLDTDGDTRIVKDRSRSAIIRLRADYPMSDRIVVVGDVALFKGASAYRLPDGFDVFTDPTSIRFSSVAVVTSLGLAYQVSYPNGVSGEMSAGVGHRTARTNIKVNSAILDTNTTSTISNQHVFVGAKLGYDTAKALKRPSAVFVQGKVKRFNTGEYDYGVSIGMRLN